MNLFVYGMEDMEMRCNFVGCSLINMGWACSTYGEKRGVYRVLVGKPEG